MTQELYSVDQVAERLGLHVRTVRGYVRDGRLKAVRIGKQYRIAGTDLQAFTGHPVAATPAESARRSRHVEVSSIVQIDAIDADDARRLSNTIMAAIGGPRENDQPLKVEAVYDEERARMKVIVLGGVDTTAYLLRIIDTVIGGSA